MNIKSWIWRGLGTVILAACAGCTYAHRVVNTGDSMLYAVTVQAGGDKFGHGYLPPAATKGYSGTMQIKRVPAPVVCWKTSERGVLIAQQVSLDADPGTREVVFQIDGKTVRGIIRNR